MSRRGSRRGLVGAVAVHLWISLPGCAHTIPVDADEIEQLKSSDWVQVELPDGETLQLHSPRMAGDSLVGNLVLPGGRSGGRRAVATDRITTLSVREGEGVRMVTGLGIVFGGFYLLGWYLYNSGT